MADNEFVIDTSLDTKDAETGAQRLNERIKGMTRTIEKMSDKEKIAFQNSVNSYNKSAKAVENQKQKIQQLSDLLENMNGQQVETEEYAEISKQIDKAQERLNKLTEAQELFIDNGGKKSSQTYKKRQAEIEELKKTIEYAKAEQQDLIDSGGAYTDMDTSKLEKQIEDAKSKLEDMQNDLYTKGLKLKLILDTAKSKYGFSLGKFFKAQFDGVKKMAQGTGNFIKGTFKKAFNIGNIASIGVKGVKTAFNKIKNVFKNPKSLAKPFDMGAKKILKYGLGIRSLFVLVNKLRSALTEGIKNMANFNNGNNATNKALTDLKSSLTQLKNSFATAFAPVIQIVAPTITNLINLLNSLVTQIGMVIAKLTGASSFVKAKKVVDNYADSVSNANKQLSGFDELNNTSSGSGSGGLSADDMFETVDIDESAINIADRLRDAWENEDFESIGADIGKRISDGLNQIPWAEIQSKARQFGGSLATLFNGILESDGFGFSIGNTLAQGFNTGIAFFHEFLSNFHFDSLGITIGNAINGALLNINWNMLGENFALKVNGIATTVLNAVRTIRWTEIATSIASGINTAIHNIDARTIGTTIGEVIKNSLNGIATFIQEVNWYELGTKVQECITSVDWNGVADALFNVLGSALGGLASFLWGIIEQAMSDLKDWWYENAFENGEFSITGLLDGILEALVSIGTWIYDHIFTPIKEGFCNAFKIHSPSEVFSEWGEFMVQGLFDGIDGMIDDVVQLWINFKDTVVGVFNDLWNGIKGVINSILGGIESMANGVVRGINAIINTLNGLSIDIPSTPWTQGGTIGFNIPNINEISIPRLATGTVVPRQSSEFMAMLGDNNRETEIVSPLSTMIEAFNTALNNREDTNILREILQAIYDKETGITEDAVFDSVQRSARRFTRETGRYAF